ncbi:MAG: hypothetical protein WDN06_02990 [Asticcacaulis sp.]
MEIKSRCFVILGIDHQGEAGNFSRQDACRPIPQQGAAKPLSLKCAIDGQTPHARYRYGRITRQGARGGLRQGGQDNARRSQGIITGDPAIGGDSNETTGHLPAHILRNLGSKIAVERRRPG